MIIRTGATPHSLDVSLEHFPGSRMGTICSNDEIGFNDHCLLRIPAIETLRSANLIQI